MDAHLKALAAVSEALSAAEELLTDGEPGAARERLDVAEDGLAALRARWPTLGAAERRLVGATAAPLRTRLDGLAARVPARGALVRTPAVADPGQEHQPGPADPAAAQPAEASRGA